MLDLSGGGGEGGGGKPPSPKFLLPPRKNSQNKFKKTLSVIVAWWYRLPIGTEQVVSSIPGSVGYISHVHWAYDYIGLFWVLWVHMAWHKNCVKNADPSGFPTNRVLQTIYYSSVSWKIKTWSQTSQSSESIPNSRLIVQNQSQPYLVGWPLLKGSHPQPR